MSKNLVFHVDVNSAFLSWEAARRVANGEPDLRLIPSAVGGDPTKRTGIIVTKSIPAKKYGIEAGEPVSMALRKCPGLVVVEPDFEWYSICSRAFKKICKEYTPAMEPASIDEVFMDMSGMDRIYPDPVKTAYEIKDRIKNELGFTVNVGIGENKVCAKMASDFEKPDKVHTLFPNEIPVKMWPLPIGDLFCCGKSSAARLTSENIKTIGDLAHSDIQFVKAILGEKSGHMLYEFANGICDSPVTEEWEDAKSYSVENTVEDDLDSMDKINRMLLAQADVVAARLRRDEVKCRCICVKFRNLDFKTRSHQKKLSESTDVTEVIFNTAKDIMAEAWKGDPLRLIGLSLSDIDKGEYEQLSFIEDEHREKMKKLDTALDTLRGKFGNDSVKRASTLDYKRTKKD